MRPRLLIGESTDPAVNLAVEEALLLQGTQGPALFLWQNAHTVVIGRGQNAWKECRTQLLSDEGGTLVRRTTGGGAVYHDLGNLNFSFVMPKAMYDVQQQLQVIRQAVAAFGVKTESSGRNDIIISGTGEKFSGNAFRHTQDASLHHGTILCDVDMQKLGRYLAPSRQKLQAKGVESVRSRVGNLKNHAPGMDIPALKSALQDAFEENYGKADGVAWEEALNLEQVAALTLRNRSWDWTYGRTPVFDITLENRFAWGQAELLLTLKRGVIESAVCHTDANDADLAERIATLLSGCSFTPRAMGERLLASSAPEDREMGQWLHEQTL